MIRQIFGSTVLVITISISGNAMSDNEEQISDSSFRSKSMRTKLSLSADIKSRHTWRGSLTCSAMNIQPTLEFKKSLLTVGTWGCYAVDNSYSEVDIYATYTSGSFSFSLLDYYSPNETLKPIDFFQFNSNTTRHTIDANVVYQGGQNFPMRLMVGTMVYGDDRSDSTGANRYSTYMEAGYTIPLSSTQRIDLFVGGTPHQSFYNNQPGIVNIGFTAHQTTKILRQQDLPVYVSFVVNPTNENLFLVIGITLL